MSKRGLKRKPDPSDLPLCKYGPLCYQKSAVHHSKFRHLLSSSDSDVLKLPVNVDSNKKYVKKLDSIRDDEASGETHAEDSREETKNDQNHDHLTTDTSAPVSKYVETVQEVLDSMPQDFFDFWAFCCSLNKNKPEDAFGEIGLHLVGTYDLLAKKLPKSKKVSLHCHYRYYYDPPEFQTVVRMDGKDLHHIGYIRDDPKQKPSILASNSSEIGPKLNLMGDNVFAAMSEELSKKIKNLDSNLKNKFTKIHEKLKAFAKEKKFSLDINSEKCKARKKKVVAKTFHGLGVVVPIVNDVGYRPLPDSEATLKNILKKIVNAATESRKFDMEESLDEIITNVQFANDECDFGMGLELGIDLFCYGDPYFHSHILNILPLAYELLKRPRYGEIVRVHLADRKKIGISTIES